MFGRLVCLLSVFALLGAASAGEVKFSKRCLMVNPNEGSAVGDINGDGRPDIVAGTHWFAAPDFVPRPVRDIPQTMTEFYANNGDHLYDVDGDGRLDVISGGWMESEIYWYKNPGNLGDNPGKQALNRGWKWEEHLLKRTRGQNEAFHLYDVDGDKVSELLVACWIKKDPLVAWKFVKDEKGQPTVERRVIGDQGGGHGYAFGDVNGDGREDILCEAGWYERPAGDVWAKPWKFHPETALPHPSCPFLAVDLTGDGRAELIWGKAHDYGLFWWEQGQPKSDGTTTWTEHVIDKSWSQIHCMVWTDIDGDGQPDVVTGKRMRGHGDKDPGSADGECLYYYTWNGATRQFTRHTISAPGTGPGTGMQIRVADMTGDGRPDIVVSGKTGTWLLINEGVK